ncbi:uncharacterized protein DUF4383 [Scopulibacillus darangshiensis]|uniref:Uncharacterized protein DUF4383 n=1 Tax=Scopulibacillus darangshiensis TaxID=442528 RepID=A0A4R2P6Z9_9BACL|nr:DUF4383 domain-containing protein [Scopulibacillus darangshiensis]TCP30018.1 uncharacterized protein DUF4383 [Scopulibacillus darangshiensis]
MARATVRVLGVIFLILGIVGFFISFDDLFSLTLNHNIVHLLTGIILLAASGSEASSALVAKIFGFIYLVVFIVGLFTQDILGIMLLPADDVLHVIIAAVLLYVGFKSASVTTNRTKNTQA